MLLSALRSGSPIVIIMTLLASVFLVFCVIPLHEFAHAWVAYKMGDKSVKLRGRLTLNPLQHIDPIGAVMIVLIGFGWGKSCPVDERNFKDPRKGIALTAIAGPLSNILLGWLMIFLAVVFSHVSAFAGTVLGGAVNTFFVVSAQISVYIAVLNLLPVPPLDGFNVLSVFLSDKAYYKVMANQQIISIAVIILLFTGILSTPLSGLANLLMNLFFFLSELPFSLIAG